ncbi:hypothetical protein ABZP36_024083 [Zizania latifolia]
MVLMQLHHRSNKKEVDTLEEDVDFIKTEFVMMKSALMDVVEKRSQMAASRSLSTWFRLLFGLAHNVEDCLMEFYLHLEKPSRAACSKQLLLPRGTIAKRMRSLRNQIKQVNTSSDHYNSAISSSGAQSQLNTGPTVVASRNVPLIGREKEKSDLIQLIYQEGEQHRVMSVYGMVGIGKTTLVRSVYESQEISTLFKQRAWVTISHPFNHHDILASLPRELDAQSYSLFGSGTQSSRRCLIILDDILYIEEWNLIQPHLPEDTSTHIIVITREASVAKHCSTTDKNIYKLEYLEDNEALELFKNKVFMGSSDIDLNDDMTIQAKLITNECDGHPLAITTIAGFLARKPKTTMEWKKLNDDLSAGSRSNPNLETISRALAPSYDDLPYHLKLCLLYICVFPKGHNIRRKRLVRRWVIEDYASNTHNMSAEQVGERYFQEFINRSIIRPLETVTHNAGSIDYCQVHSLIHDIIASKSKEENHGIVLGHSSNNQDTIRHLSIISKGKMGKDMLESSDLSHVRSVTVFGEWTSDFNLGTMRLLRVLDLEGTFGLKDHDLKKIGNLLLLKYLSLRGCVDIYHLPNGLGKLWDLQMLDVSGTSIIKLPKAVTKLKKLLYLRAGNVPNDDDTSSSKLKMSRYLSKWLQKETGDGELPQGSAKIVQLGTTSLNNEKKSDKYHKYKVLLPTFMFGRDMHGVETPDGISELDVLHTLGVVNVASRKAILDEIEKLTKLHKLGLTGINKKNSQGVLCAIAKLTLLRSLSLRAEGKPGLHGCLDHDISLLKNLHSLKLYGNLVILPTWITQLQHLVKLKLQSTQLELAFSMEVLGKLPHLAILQLWKDSFQGEEIIYHFQQGLFPSLVMLELSDQDGLKSFRFMNGALPRLQSLYVENCIHVDNNGFSGMSFLPSLKEVMLNGDYNNKFMDNLRAQLTQNQNQPVLKWAWA